MEIKSSPRYLIKKGVSLSLINIWRNKFLSLATIFVIGIIIFIFNIILIINLIAGDSISNLNKKVDIVVYLKETTQYSDVQTLTDQIKQLNGVTSVTYTSKDAALQELKTTHPDLSLAFEKYDLGNPLPASLNIATVSPSFHESIANTLNQDQYQKYLSNIVSNNSENNAIISSVSKNLNQLTDFTNQIIFWLIMTFTIGGALITLNALQITIFSRQKEIEVMKLVGASRWFIRLPFVIEGVIYGLCATILSFIMLFILAQRVQVSEIAILSDTSRINFYLIFAIELVVATALTAVSSLIAVHEHLIKKSI